MTSKRKPSKRPAGSFGAMLFGGRFQQTLDDFSDEEKMAATLKAEEVRNSMSHLYQTHFQRPVVALDGETDLDTKTIQTLVVETEVSVGMKEALVREVGRRDNAKEEVITTVADDDQKASNSLEDSVASLEDKSPQPSFTSSDMEGLTFPELFLPLPLSQMYRSKSRKNRGNKKARLNHSSNELITTPVCEQKEETESIGPELSAATGHVKPIDGPDIEPFDYTAARQNFGFKQGSESHHQKLAAVAVNAKGTGSLKSQHHCSEADMIFDPTRRMRSELKAHDFKPGKRRQVFPQSGNRTGTFS